ncbi:amino acid ABC transporter permease [Rhizobium sp. ARZ01]|uniref:amino acid ABC transporter permease n=1 Tax=Rhizobium sp. ARZ01 TaxID=2769313 RepID=UPI00178129A3|nr:amino acid ABC transporter permease [Rhizobium sp. ARZ01]MBD9374945.1 amino acid ABC transporter permease [Rhizobium sp. ARZ01]
MAEKIVSGLWLTLFLTVAAQAIGTAGGILLAAMSISPNGLLKAVSAFYIWIFRGTPALIQIIFWFNIALVFPNIFIGVPWTSIGVSYPTNSLITPLVTAVVALGLNEAAYMAEIVRGGLLSVDSGQREAAASIGLTHSKALRYIILPQALRAIIPPTGNELISMLKNTSLVSVIAAQELLTSMQQIYAMNFLTIELLIVASIWYLILTTLATIAQGFLERWLARTDRARPKPALYAVLWKRSARSKAL